jgi:HK97 family phage major capsid protein
MGIDLKSKRTEVQTLVNQAKTLYADLEAQGDKASAEDRVKLNNLIDAGTKARAELDGLEKLAALDGEFNTPAAEAKAQETPARPMPRKTWGQLVTESKQFRENDGRNVAPVDVPGGVKTVINLGTTFQSISEPVLYDMDRQPGVIDIARQQPPSVLDLINVVRTTLGAVEYVSLTARQNMADVVAEAGAKPQSDMSFALNTASVKTIAHWVGAARQILADAPQLQDTINGELLYGLRRKLEDSVLNGSGSGNQFTGILNWSGIATRVMDGTTPVGRGQTTTDTKIDTIRRAITDIRLAFYQANGVVLNPADGEALELAKDSQGRYLNIYDPVAFRIWRVAVIETPAITALTGLVGDFTLGATLWDREQANVRVSENVSDDFIKNMVRILAELRAAFAVVRPLCFEKITFI